MFEQFVKIAKKIVEVGFKEWDAQLAKIENFNRELSEIEIDNVDVEALIKIYDRHKEFYNTTRYEYYYFRDNKNIRTFQSQFNDFGKLILVRQNIDSFYTDIANLGNNNSRIEKIKEINDKYFDLDTKLLIASLDRELSLRERNFRKDYFVITREIHCHNKQTAKVEKINLNEQKDNVKKINEKQVASRNIHQIHNDVSSYSDTSDYLLGTLCNQLTEQIDLERIKDSSRTKREPVELTVKVERDLNAKLIEDLKEQHKFEGLHHYTDITNLFKIIKTGKLLSRNRAIESGFTDAADHGVLSHTDCEIMSYVRFYYKEKTPTIYRNEGIKLDNSAPHMPIPVLLLFDECIIQHAGVAFLSGGGGNPNSLYTRDIATALDFDWNVIFSRGPIPRYENSILSIGNDSSGASITNKRNAEFLYPTEISIKHIKKIIFRSPADIKTAKIVAGKNNLFLLDNDRLKFYYKHNFLYNYDIMQIGKDFIIALTFWEDFHEYTHEICIFYDSKTVERLNVNRLPSSRRTDLHKPMGYEDFDYYFRLTTLQNKRATRIEYLMNGHLSALWEEHSI